MRGFLFLWGFLLYSRRVRAVRLQRARRLRRLRRRHLQATLDLLCNAECHLARAFAPASESKLSNGGVLASLHQRVPHGTDEFGIASEQMIGAFGEELRDFLNSGAHHSAAAATLLHRRVVLELLPSTAGALDNL
uniref:Uncharacterized protein n=1 Tax=Arundo donax TaxID=35708 RepID=A0A0A9TQU5_ARUDO